MARLNEQNDSDEEFPELSELLRFPTKVHEEKESRDGLGEERMKQSQIGNDDANLTIEHLEIASDKKKTSRQRPLKLVHVNSLLLPIHKTESQWNTPTSIKKTRIREIQPFVNKSASALILHGHSNSEDRLADFIVNDSDGDMEGALIEISKTSSTESRRQVEPKTQNIPLISQRAAIDLTSSERPNDTPRYTRQLDSKGNRLPKQPRASENSFEDDPEACLRFSPPRSGKVHKPNNVERPLTPPSSPSKDKLQSPTRRHQIPPSPHRPSIDAFWSQEIINEWNDQHSPKKTPSHERSKKLYSINEDDVSEISLSESPRKPSSKSPAKKDKRAIEQRKLFEKKKHATASLFLKELDEKITDGQVTALASSAGGIHIIWSKKLNSTAGRANWKRETLRSRDSQGVNKLTTHRHHASIELAEKIIDDEDRLFNVIAHEYCHLANFMISGVKDNPHGKEFKEWAQKVTTAYAHLGIHVTTKHSYAIAYKYIWACTAAACGIEFKRHSRSIDPARHSCGKCKSPLVQIQPPPRASAAANSADPSRYQAYVKKHFARVREENPGAGMGAWMTLLGKGFREERDAKRGGKEEIVPVADEAFDQVARKLDFLSLGN